MGEPIGVDNATGVGGATYAADAIDMAEADRAGDTLDTGEARSNPDVRFLVFDAYGLGGTVRITLETANALAAAGLRVEVVSMVQSHSTPRYDVDPAVGLVALAYSRHGNRRGAAWREMSRLQQFFTRVPSVLVPRSDRAYGHFSLYSDLMVLRWYVGLTGGTVVGTRLGINMLLTRLRRLNASVDLALQEHTHLGSHTAEVRQAIGRRYRSARWVTTLTETDAAAYRRLLRGRGPEVVVVRNNLPELDYRPSSRNSKVILTVARLSAEKGIDLLVAAFAAVVAAHPGWKLHIVGAGSRRRAVLNQIYRLKLHNSVFLLGDRRDVVPCYEAASIYVQPSRFEGFGLAILEAMASGLPVIAFDCPVGPREIITHERDGLLVPAEDTAALADAMITLIRRPDLRDDLAVTGATRAEHFRTEHTIRPWGRILDAQ